VGRRFNSLELRCLLGLAIPDTIRITLAEQIRCARIATEEMEAEGRLGVA
jgi:hypothetical protein